MAKTSVAAKPANEGEGNKTAARQYNKAQRNFVESGQVDEKARDAERALDGPERAELEAAEAIGKSRAAGEDPEITQVAGDSEKVRARAYEIWEHEGRPHGRDHDHWRQAEREVGNDKTKPVQTLRPS
jgi:hypothetical protein